ncbi:esterase/lipase family protein [Kitasatospora sp. NPDC004289]
MRRLLPIAVATAAATTSLLSAPALADTATAPAAAGAAAGVTPVILVHGRNAGPGVWGAATAALTARGVPADRIFAWSYDTSASTNEVLAGRLATYVDQVLHETGAAKVDLVAHSLGSLPTRWYVKFGDGGRTVRNWVSLGGPNHGTGLAWFCALWDQGCKDMTPNSYVLGHLNTAPETPDPVHYHTFWSSCDEQISPPSSTELAGAVNTRTAACLKHNDLLTDPTVLAQLAASLSD